jgi:RNA polymerase sigma factor, sigma-70 family
MYFSDLVVEYKGLVRALAKKYYLPGSDHDDVVQEGFMGLYKAVRDFKPEGKMSFKSFASMVIERHLISALKTARRGKALILTRAERLETHLQEERYAHVKEFGELIATSAADPLTELIAEEETAAFLRALSPLEKQVLKCRVAGYSIQETAAVLSRTPKAIDNALSRIKNKFRAGTELLTRAAGQ